MGKDWLGARARQLSPLGEKTGSLSGNVAARAAPRFHSRQFDNDSPSQHLLGFSETHRKISLLLDFLDYEFLPSQISLFYGVSNYLLSTYFVVGTVLSPGVSGGWCRTTRGSGSGEGEMVLPVPDRGI